MIKEVFFTRLKDVLKVNDSPFRKYFIYEEKNIIIGYIVVDIIYDRIEIIDIFVEPSKRHRKIGTNMLKYIVDLAQSSNILNITLEVNINNVYAIKLYENLEFKKVAIRKCYYGNDDAILMELII